MVKSFLTIAFRNLLKFKVHSFINLIGLSLGLTSAILILLFVLNELSFDQFHSNIDRLYRVETYSGDDTGSMDTNGWPVGQKLVDEYPEIESVVYTRNGSNLMVNHNGKRYEHDLHYASSDFFKLFSFKVLEGDPVTALSKPNSLVITEKVKASYFGAELVVGETLILSDTLEFTISAVIADLPTQSHIQFDMLASFATYKKVNPYFNYSEGWGNINVRNYVLLKEGTNVDLLNGKIKNIYMDNAGEWLSDLGVDLYVKLQPVRNLYLTSTAGNGFGPTGSMDRLYLTSAIAFFILLLACINFVNLTTARSVYRAKEVGMRKIVGSSRSSIFWQFLTESFFITFLAFTVSIILADLILPAFNSLMNQQFDFSNIFQLEIIVCAFLLVIVVSFLSGYYPAYVLSGYKPIEVLKVKLQSGKKGIGLRRFLVVFQFVISAGLVILTFVVISQLEYMKNEDLGFDKDQVLVLDVTRVPKTVSHTAFKNALSALPSINNMTQSNAVPGRPGWQGQWAYPEGIQEGEHVTTEYMAIDENYLQTLGLDLLAGRNFQLDRQSELDEGLIINETAMLEMGWYTPTDALGKKITSPSQSPEGTVIGVIKDYHGLGLQEDIWPKVMDYKPQIARYYSIKYDPRNTSQLVKEIETQWKKALGDYELEYFFLDEDFDRQYAAEERLMNVFSIFALTAIIIAVIGLLGLVSFMVNARNKEIGVRKVLGATVFSITRLLSKEFVILVIIGNLIAIPLCWYLGKEWLSTFAYNTEVSPTIFLITFIGTLLIALSSVSFQTVKAALSNPVDTLRDE